MAYIQIEVKKQEFIALSHRFADLRTNSEEELKVITKDDFMLFFIDN